MRITDVAALEDCSDDSRAFRYEFDEPWTRETVGALAALGRLERFPDFPRPMFSLRTPQGLHVKGVEDEMNCRVICPRANADGARQAFEAHFS